MLYSFAFLLDPRAKMKGLNKLPESLSIFVGTDHSTYYTYVHLELTNFFKKYEAKFGDVRLQRASQPVYGISKKKSAWVTFLALLILPLNMLLLLL
jgi:hypothetical protein